MGLSWAIAYKEGHIESLVTHFCAFQVDLVAASASDCRGDDGRDEHRQQLGCLGHASGSFAVGKGALIEHVAVSEK